MGPLWYSDLRFTDWLQIAHQLIKTLIVLKLNGVIHRDVKTDNILVKFDGNTSKDEIEKLNITLIDFGWARPIAKNDVDMTLNAGTQGKIAPEIILRNAVYKSKITEKPYSFPVDMFSSGITLLEIFKKDLFPNLEAAFNIKQDGNTRKNETAGISLFASMCEEFNYDAEEQRNILNVDKGCQHELGKSQERHFKKYVSKASTNRNLGANKSDALRFILNFWFKNLNPELGWTDEIKEQVGMFCLEMIHYWPDKRPTPEQLIGHDIFNLSDPVTGLKVIETENIERIIQKTVKRSSDTEYEIFMQKMANTQQNYILNFKPEGQIGSGAQGNETMVYSLDPLGSKTTVNIKGLGQIDKNLITGKQKGSEYDLDSQSKSASFADLPLNHELVNKSESSVSEREIKFKQKLQENFKEIKNINNDLQSFPTPNRKNDSFTINTYGLGDDGDSNDDGLYEYTDPEMYGEEELTFTDAMYCYGIKSDIWGFGGNDDQQDGDLLDDDNIYNVAENVDAHRDDTPKGRQFNEDDFTKSQAQKERESKRKDDDE